MPSASATAKTQRIRKDQEHYFMEFKGLPQRLKKSYNTLNEDRGLPLELQGLALSRWCEISSTNKYIIDIDI